VIPSQLNIQGSTQPEIFRDTVEAMAKLLHLDAHAFWQNAMQKNGPIEIWEINGIRWLYNGNHRYQAAVQAGVEIPDSQFVIVDKTGSSIVTFKFPQMTWVSGYK